MRKLDQIDHFTTSIQQISFLSFVPQLKKKNRATATIFSVPTDGSQKNVLIKEFALQYKYKTRLKLF